MDFLEEFRIKQEPEVNFELILYVDDYEEPTESVTSRQLLIKVQKVKLGINGKAKLFENFTKCEKCHKFVREWNSLQHLKICRGFDKRLICDFCSYTCKGRTQMTIHMYQHRKFDTTFRCKHCKLKLERTLQPKHVKSKKCWVCFKTFQCMGFRDKHDKEHRDKNWKLTCPYDNCNMTYELQHKLNVHITKVHSDVEMRTCKVCSKVFSSQSALSGHVKAAHGEKIVFTCDFCSYKCSSIHHFRKHKDQHLNGRDTCESCGAEFSCLSNLKEHLAIKPVRCYYCKKSFKCKPLLERHLLDVHQSSQNQRPCEECKQVFKANWALEIHQKRARHGKFAKTLKKLNCKNCSKEFSTRTDLLTHMKQKHDEVHDLKCHICSVKFKFARNLKSHLDNHDNVKLIKCNLCAFVCIAKKNLKQHCKFSHKSEK